MKKATMIRALLLGLALTGGMGSVSYADRCVPNPNPICPLIFAPVTCASTGETYSNECFAAADCARGCRPA
jgi:hypothetical protein